MNSDFKLQKNTPVLLLHLPKLLFVSVDVVAMHLVVQDHTPEVPEFQVRPVTKAHSKNKTKNIKANELTSLA
jgi:hypothetical protein